MDPAAMMSMIVAQTTAHFIGGICMPTLDQPAPRPKFKRQKRAGQLIAKPNRGQHNHGGQHRQQEGDDDFYDHIMGDLLEQDEAVSAEEFTKHGAIMAQQHTDWQEAQDKLRQRYVRHVPLFALLHEQAYSSTQQRIQLMLQEAWRFREFQLSADQPSQPLTAAPQEVSQRNAVYFSQQHRFTISVPRWQVSTTTGVVTWEPSPQDVACWGSTEAQPHIWYDYHLMEDYKHQGLRQGHSATGGQS